MKRNVLAGRISALTVLLSIAAMAAAQTPQTTTKVTKDAATVTKSELKGEVEYVEGNSLVVTMSSGEVRTFNVPESRKFLIDGKELSVHELKPGTTLTATVITTATPIVTRTTTVKSGKVWHVLRNNVIVTLPNGENKQFIVEADTRITVNGNPTTIADLRKGMIVHAERVVEQPATVITTDTSVVGQAPPQQAPKTEPAPAIAQTTPSEAPPAQAQTTPSEPPPAQAQTTPSEPAPAIAEEKPTSPKSSGPVPRVVIWGLLLVGAAIAVWIFARRKSA
jgi:hypothetical protein